jgi:hypothetical protein
VDLPWRVRDKYTLVSDASVRPPSWADDFIAPREQSLQGLLRRVDVLHANPTQTDRSLLFGPPACTERCAGEGELVFGSHQALPDSDRMGPRCQLAISAVLRAVLALGGGVSAEGRLPWAAIGSQATQSDAGPGVKPAVGRRTPASRLAAWWWFSVREDVFVIRHRVRGQPKLGLCAGAVPPARAMGNWAYDQRTCQPKAAVTLTTFPASVDYSPRLRAARGAVEVSPCQVWVAGKEEAGKLETSKEHPRNMLATMGVVWWRCGGAMAPWGNAECRM